jgi:DNA-binding CsgD family transcriptional regulator
MMSTGVSQTEMADLLGISYSKVRYGLMYARAAVGAMTNEHLIAICYERGFLGSKPSTPRSGT